MICLIRCDVPTFFFTSKFLHVFGRGVLLFFLGLGFFSFLLSGIVVIVVVVIIVVVVVIIIIITSTISSSCSLLYRQTGVYSRMITKA